MFTIAYNEENNRVHSVEATDFSAFENLSKKWIHMTNPNDKEIELVEEKCGVPADVLKAALDEEERPRIEKEDEYFMILADIPSVEDNEDDGTIDYTTLPMSIIVSNGVLISVCLKETSITRDILNGRTKDIDFGKPTRFIFKLLYAIETKYLVYLRQIDKTSQHIQAELRKKMDNDELIALLDIQNALVYFSNSLRANNNVIDKLIKSSSYLPKYEEDQDLIEDVGIESLQALDTCNTYRDILESTMNAYSSVISNNLNYVMKILTSITFIVSVPNVIGAIFGMNLDGIPGFSADGHNKFAFLIVCVIAIVVTVVCGFIMKKKKLL